MRTLYGFKRLRLELPPVRPNGTSYLCSFHEDLNSIVLMILWDQCKLNESIKSTLFSYWRKLFLLCTFRFGFDHIQIFFPFPWKTETERGCCGGARRNPRANDLHFKHRKANLILLGLGLGLGLWDRMHLR